MFNDQATTTPADPGTAPATDPAGAAQLEQLLALSQAPITLDAALEQEEAQLETTPAAPLTVGGLMRAYGHLLVLVLGIGLITAAVRHYAAGPALYGGLAAAGAVLFAGASTLSAPRATAGGLLGTVRYAALSAVLGAGLGVLVGGALHFSAFPHTATVLVPLGIALSIGAFVARDGGELIGRNLIPAAITVAGLLVWASVGLGMLAKKLDPPPAPAAPHGEAAAGHGEAAAGSHGEGGAAAAGESAEHGEAAAGEHGEAAAAGHGEAAAGDHGEAAAEGHAEAAPAEHAAPAEEHAAPAEESHAASADAHEAPAEEHTGGH